MNLRIGLLADHPELVAPLAAAYEREWPDWYGVHGDALTDLRERSRRSGLPVGLVALADGALTGTLAIAETSIASHRHLSPWIVGFWVEPSRRNRGIGARLLRSGCEHAHRERIATLYAGTAKASGLFVRDGWAVIDAVPDPGGEIQVFARAIAPS